MKSVHPYRGPSIFAILLGRHSYSMDPEDETAWCWVCLLFGGIGGLLLGLWVAGKFLP